MKKIYVFISLIGNLFFATRVLAQGVMINITPPSQGIKPTTSIGLIISNLLTIILVVGLIAVLFMFALGAFEWITSGGDKDAVARARGRILNAIVGLIILALAFLLSNVIGSIVGIDLLNSSLPRLDSGAGSLVIPTAVPYQCPPGFPNC